MGRRGMREARSKLLPLLAAAAVIGGVLTVSDLRRAAASCRSLYEMDVRALEVEAEMEYHLDESRRTLLYALATADPNEQLPYMDQTRANDALVAGSLNQLRASYGKIIPATSLDAFARRWSLYRARRDAVIARILVDSMEVSMAHDQLEGNVAFQAALEELRGIRALLRQHAGRQVELVSGILLRWTIETGIFAAALGGIIWALLRARRERNRVLADLRRSNGALADARYQEQCRAAILEMVSKREALPETLEAVAGLVPGIAPGAGAGIWLDTGGVLRLKASAGVDERTLEAVKRVESVDELHGGNTGPVSLIRDAAGVLMGALRIFHPRWVHFPEHSLVEITQLASLAVENQRLYERLAFQAQHDLLTNLPNRLLFHDRLEQAIHLAYRHASRTAVVWIDLDRYKQINDTLGHAAGDEVLREVAHRLTGLVRESDTVSRLGGDEFAVVLGEIGCIADAERVAVKIRDTLSAPFFAAGHEIRTSASCGISVYPDHGTDAAMLLRNADLAMYSAKRAGRNSYQIFAPHFGESLARRLELERELGRAIPAGELRLAYQALMDRGGRVQALEALLRWNHAKMGPVPPAEFIPIAEESGLIYALGEFVIRQACRDGLRFLEDGFLKGRIAVNVSPRQLLRPDFSAMVERVLEETGYPGERLELEVTENVFMNNLDLVVGQIDSLRELGVSFAIDDFGTGYSSLNLLRRLPVDSVKIDRCFIETLEDGDGGCGTLVRGIIALAHNMQLRVVAEGVETERQFRLLQAMNCDLSQGFLLHRPMPPDALIAALGAAAPEQLEGCKAS